MSEQTDPRCAWPLSSFGKENEVLCGRTKLLHGPNANHAFFQPHSADTITRASICEKRGWHSGIGTQLCHEPSAPSQTLDEKLDLCAEGIVIDMQTRARGFVTFQCGEKYQHDGRCRFVTVGSPLGGDGELNVEVSWP